MARKQTLRRLTAGFSTKVELVAHAINELEVVVDEKKPTQLLVKGMVIKRAMLLPPPAVRMRIVVRDATNGNVGTPDLTQGKQFH